MPPRKCNCFARTGTVCAECRREARYSVPVEETSLDETLLVIGTTFVESLFDSSSGSSDYSSGDSGSSGFDGGGGDFGGGGASGDY